MFYSRSCIVLQFNEITGYWYYEQKEPNAISKVKKELSKDSPKTNDAYIILHDLIYHK